MGAIGKHLSFLLGKYDINWKSNHPIDMNFDIDFHKYHVAIDLYGFYGWAIANIADVLGNSGNEYSFCIAFCTPKSVTGNRFAFRDKISKHLYCPSSNSFHLL